MLDFVIVVVFHAVDKEQKLTLELVRDQSVDLLQVRRKLLRSSR